MLLSEFKSPFFHAQTQADNGAALCCVREQLYGLLENMELLIMVAEL